MTTAVPFATRPVVPLDSVRLVDVPDRPRYGEYDILTPSELAAFFDVSERAIERMHFPTTTVGRHPFYCWADVVAFLRRRAG